MDPVEKRLEKLDKEIADLTATVKAAGDAFLSATDPQQKAFLEKCYEKLAELERDRISQRHDLQLKLSSSGEHME